MRLNLTILVLVHCVSCDYLKKRDDFIKREIGQAIGSAVTLNKAELRVNKYLMQLKGDDFDQGFINVSRFNGARYIFDAIDDIENSEIFHFIKELPKGASLHGHDTGLVSFEYLYNLTYKDNLYACKIKDKIRMSFIKKPLKNCNWELLQLLRLADPDVDYLLKTQLSMLVKDHNKDYPNSYKAWITFGDLFVTVAGLLLYKPVFEEYVQQILTELYEDNVMYLEMRTTLPKIYDLDGKIYNSIELVEILQQISNNFVESHPNFLGFKIIYAPYRKVSNDVIESYIGTLKDIKSKYPNFVIGFDLVGEEDQGRPLIDFIDYLKEAKKYTNLYLHAGETNWYGMPTDNNLIDAILLGAKRIGHGYAITKHPEVVKTILKKQIAVEISPISNQVLALVNDLRNHPASTLIAWGIPIVICNDDPSFFGTKALSYDWYMAFMALAGRDADLRFLKEVALNSLVYSSFKGKEKTSALLKWEMQWNLFIKKMSHKIKLLN